MSRKHDVAGLTKQNGNSHPNYKYDPYGGVIPETGNFTDPHNHYTLTGKEFDENTGLICFGARHYDVGVGGWISQDYYRGDLSIPTTLHRYAYCLLDPINYYDPDGEFANFLIGAATSVALGYGISVLTGEEYSWKEAVTDAALGAVGAGIVSKLNKVRRSKSIVKVIYNLVSRALFYNVTSQSPHIASACGIFF